MNTAQRDVEGPAIIDRDVRNTVQATHHTDSGRRRQDRRERSKSAQSCKSYALWLLSRREYSAANLRQKLLQRGYALEEIKPAMAFLSEHQFQSDVRHAGMKSRSVQHRAGDRKIALVLKGKGIAADLAAEQIETLPAPKREGSRGGAQIPAPNRSRRPVAGIKGENLSLAGDPRFLRKIDQGSDNSDPATAIGWK